MVPMSRSARINVAVLALAVGLGLTGMASAATFDAAATGAWNTATTWGGSSTPSSAADVINIGGSYTVSATTSAAGTFTGGTINLTGSGRLNITNSYQSTAPAALNLYFNNGGTFGTGSGNTFKGGGAGVQQVISVIGTGTIVGSGAGDTTVIGGSSNETKLTGTGTLIKQGGGQLTLEANNAATTNQSDFSGTIDVQAGTLSSNHAYILRNATVNLGGSTTKLNFMHGTTTLASTPVLKGLTGTGSIVWANSSYARDLAIAPGGLLSPGTASAAGTITKATTTLGGANLSKNELIFRTDGTSGNSKLEMDIFGDTQAQADKITWFDSISTSTVDFHSADLKVRMFTPTQSLAMTSWTIIEADQFGIATNQLDAAAAASAITFASVQFVADPRWQNLSISYDRTAENSKVIVSGQFVVPEPTIASLMMGCGILLGLRRRRA